MLNKLKEILSVFDADQLREIGRGLEQGVDIAVYAKPEFNAAQMYEIRLGLLSNVDVSIYAKPKFTMGQM